MKKKIFGLFERGIFIMLKIKLKRCLAAAVSAVMMCGMVGLSLVGTMQLAEPIVAEAYNWDLVDDYPLMYKAADLDALEDEWKYYNRECTSFVAWRLNSRNGVAFHNFYGGVNFGHAKSWGSAARSIGITVDMNPAPGSIFWQEGGIYGHVAWVNTVNSDGTVTIEEYNWNGDGAYHYRPVSSTSASGYIHIADIIPGPIPDPEPIPDPVPTGKEMSESEAAGQTLPDGDYYIFSAINRNYYLDIEGKEYPAANETNVVMYISETGYPKSHDVWTIKYLNNGFYTIKQKGTNMCLDVSDASLNRGTNVWAWVENVSTAQQWSIVKTDTGYKIQSRCNSYYLDVDDRSFKAGTNVQVWEGNDTTAQRFCFVPYGPSVGQTIEDGTYTIASAIDFDYGFDVQGYENTSYTNGTNVQLWKIKDGNDTFDVKYLGDGYYSICESISGLSLSIDNKNPSEYLNLYKNVQMNTYSDTNNQRWIIRDAGNGYYSIISANSGYYVDLDGGIIEPRRNIAQYMYNNTAAQKWKFEAPIPAPAHSKITVDKATVLVGETITFTAEADNATSYMLKIDKDGKQIDTQAMPDGQLSFTFSETGTYSAYVTASNRSGSVDSQSITFEVKTDITLYDSEKYTLPFSSDYTFKTNNSDVAVVSKSGVVTAISVGKAIISVIDADANVIQIKVNVLPEAIVGDCNKDGELNVADVVFLQKYLVKSQNLPSEKFLSADINSDGKINVFDVIKLKRIILNA